MSMTYDIPSGIQSRIDACTRLIERRSKLNHPRAAEFYKNLRTHWDSLKKHWENELLNTGE